jgi:hypothetical protein
MEQELPSNVNIHWGDRIVFITSARGAATNSSFSTQAGLNGNTTPLPPMLVEKIATLAPPPP